jgi:hypothetical protein
MTWNQACAEPFKCLCEQWEARELSKRNQKHDKAVDMTFQQVILLHRVQPRNRTSDSTFEPQGARHHA